MGKSHVGRGGNGARYALPHVGKASVPEGHADWYTDGQPKKNGFPTAPLVRKQVETLLTGGHTIAQVHDAVQGVSLRTVQELGKRKRAVGNCDAGLHGRPAQIHRTLTEPIKLFLQAVNAAEPTRTTAQLTEDVFKQFGVTVSPETIRRDLHEGGISNKVLAPLDQRAFTAANVLRAAQWSLIKPTLPSDQCVFIDETGKRPSDANPVRPSAHGQLSAIGGCLPCDLRRLLPDLPTS